MRSDVGSTSYQWSSRTGTSRVLVLNHSTIQIYKYYYYQLFDAGARNLDDFELLIVLLDIIVFLLCLNLCKHASFFINWCLLADGGVTESPTRHDGQDRDVLKLTAGI